MAQRRARLSALSRSLDDTRRIQFIDSTGQQHIYYRSILSCRIIAIHGNGTMIISLRFDTGLDVSFNVPLNTYVLLYVFLPSQDFAEPESPFERIYGPAVHSYRLRNGEPVQ